MILFYSQWFKETCANLLVDGYRTLTFCISCALVVRS
jgi:hypothetical protein